MKKRKNKNKKKRRIYIIVLILIYLSSFFITIKYSISKEDKLVNYMLEDNIYINKKDNKKIITKLVSYIASVELNNPISFISNNYTLEEIDKKIIDNYVKDPKPDLDIKKPIIYLYNTHQQETYKKSNNLDYNVTPTVMTMSYILREKLNNKNLPTIVEENNISEFLKTNNWNYASSYKVSRMLLNDIKEKEPTLEYFIDLHRDSVNRKISTITINNISYAKVLFILGLENSNYKENEVFINKLNNMINDKYNGLSRGIYRKSGKGVNGVYNQDFDKNTILIEVGGEENTIDEVSNTCSILADILEEYIRG